MVGLTRNAALRLLDAEHRRNDLLIRRVSELEEELGRQTLEIIDLRRRAGEWQTKYEAVHRIALDVDRQRIRIIKERT